MIRSMTGFGSASEQNEGIHYSVEIRSLNNRYFKATIRTPEEISGIEAELESQLRRRLARGSVTLTVKTRIADASAAHKVNDAALVAYLEHLSTLQGRVASTGMHVNIDLTELLSLPGVLEPADEDLMKRAQPVIIRLLGKAIDRLNEMREADGRTIAEDLSKQRNVIRDRLNGVAGRAPQVIEEYHQRLRARIDELLARASLKLEEKDLIREVALFAERADISEEVTRLSSHLDQFERVADANSEDPAGRTLDFIAQEMLREANTIGSKSNDAPISRAIVEIKTAIDRIKEQVQNVE